MREIRRRFGLALPITFFLIGERQGLCQATPSNDSPQSPILFGTLQTQGTHAAQEYAGGVRLAMLEIFWDRYEKSDGSFDTAYAATRRETLKKLKDTGLRATLGLGTHYPPRWLAAKGNARFINQNGEKSRDVNFVFNARMRRYPGRYLAHTDKDLGLKNFWVIRLTSGGNAEVLYPDGGTYWAFDPNAQNGPDLT